MQAETDEQDCLAARVRLAACEEESLVAAAEGAFVTTATTTTASPDPPATPTDGELAPSDEPPSDQPPGAEHSMVREVTYGEPLVVEGLLSGDRDLLELTAGRVADRTGLVSGTAVVQLQELTDAIVSAASQHGFLIFDEEHRFWSHLSSAEASDVVAALGRLGFLLEPSEGWHAGRVPASMDLSMALAYAGLDARSIRNLPDSDELADLPRTIDVDAQAFLASYAPDLGLDHLVSSLGHRAEALGALWDEWGQIRPILLTEQRELVSDTGT